jgi:hypothetical protein
MTESSGYSPQQSFARDLLTLAVNGGITHWARVHGYRADVPPDEVLAEGVDLRDNRSLWVLDLADVQNAINAVIDTPDLCFDPSFDPTTRDRVTTRLRASRDALLDGRNDARNDRIDPEIADIVVQVAIAGEVIY